MFIYEIITCEFSLEFYELEMTLVRA